MLFYALRCRAVMCRAVLDRASEEQKSAGMGVRNPDTSPYVQAEDICSARDAFIPGSIPLNVRPDF